MAPVVIALLLSTAWILGSSVGDANWRLVLLALGAGLVIWRTRLHLLWVLAAGALLGALGLV
jgi:chromate transporter